MDSFTLNKISGAILGTFLLLFAISLASEQIFPEPESHGAEQAAAEAPADGAASAEAEPPAAADALSLAAALAAGNADNGAKVFKKCAACHTVEAAAGNKIGPNLHGIVGRKVASADGFAYSPAMSGHGGEWTDERLDAYLTNPKLAVPGNKMAFAGLKKQAERADLILYLRASSPKAPPLPKQ